MSEFKVGDRVRVINRSYASFGSLVQLVKVTPSGMCYDGRQIYFPAEIEPAPPVVLATGQRAVGFEAGRIWRGLIDMIEDGWVHIVTGDGGSWVKPETLSAVTESFHDAQQALAKEITTAFAISAEKLGETPMPTLAAEVKDKILKNLRGEPHLLTVNMDNGPAKTAVNLSWRDDERGIGFRLPDGFEVSNVVVNEARGCFEVSFTGPTKRREAGVREAGILGIPFKVVVTRDASGVRDWFLAKLHDYGWDVPEATELSAKFDSLDQCKAAADAVIRVIPQLALPAGCAVTFVTHGPQVEKAVAIGIVDRRNGGDSHFSLTLSCESASRVTAEKLQAFIVGQINRRRAAKKDIQPGEAYGMGPVRMMCKNAWEELERMLAADLASGPSRVVTAPAGLTKKVVDAAMAAMARDCEDLIINGDSNAIDEEGPYQKAANVDLGRRYVETCRELAVIVGATGGDPSGFVFGDPPCDGVKHESIFITEKERNSRRGIGEDIFRDDPDEEGT